MATWTLLACLAWSAAAAPASAAAPTPDKLLRLIRRRPRRMSVDAWREQRREAVRELGRLKERRAVPALLKIIAKERFDVILEIAIDALGNIGDKRAIAPLRKLLNDPSLDGYVRDAVAGALQKLGDNRGTPERTTPPPTTDQPKKPTANDKPSTSGAVDASGVDIATHMAETIRKAGFGELLKLDLSEPDPNLIAHTSRFDIVAGAADVRWDGWSANTSAAVSLGTRYRRQVERKRLGYSVDSAASFAFRLNDPPGDNNTTWGLDHSASANPEVRYYPFLKDLPLLFGQLIGGVSYGVNVASPASSLDNRVSFGTTLSLGIGPGYGRVVDVGPRLRLRRVERVLRKAGVLSESIDGATANTLLAQWYALRNALGSYAHLGYALRTLREADLLKNPVNAATLYRLVRILDDPQLLDRWSGMMFRVGYGYAHEIILDADDRNHGFLYGTAEAHLQRGTIREIHGTLRMFWNHLGDPDSFSVNIEGAHNWYLYNRAFDPLGAIGLTVSAGVNNQPGGTFSGGGVTYQFLGGASYTRFFGRGSRIIAGLRAGADRRGGLLFFSLEAQYGVANGAFVSAE